MSDLDLMRIKKANLDASKLQAKMCLFFDILKFLHFGMSCQSCVISIVNCFGVNA
jgi:hypothetical protein